MAEPLNPEARVAVEQFVDQWITSEVAENPALVGVERGGPDDHLWILRVAGEVKQAFAIWLRVDQRSLFYETNLVPAPPKEREAIFGLLLRRNHTMRGAAFEIAAEGAIYVAGQIPLTQVNAETLDAIVGALYQYTEENFATVLRLGFQ
jgi:hypothetical protein